MSFAHLPDPGWVPLDIPFISSGRTYIPAVSKPTIPEIKRTIPAIPVTQPTIPETKPITDEIKKKIAQWIPTAANANIGLAVLWIVGLILGIATIAKYKKGKAINQNDYKISLSISNLFEYFKQHKFWYFQYSDMEQFGFQIKV